MNTIKIILTFISAFLLAANAAATSDCMDKYTDLTAYGPWKNDPECKISLSEAIENNNCRFGSNKNDGYELDLTDLSLTTIDDIQGMLTCLEDSLNFSSVDISNNFINCETLYDGAKDDEGSSDDYTFELTCNSFLQCGALNKEECYKHSSVCFFEDYQCKTLNATVPNPKVVLSFHSALETNPTVEKKAEVETSIRNVITSYLKGIGVEASAVRITIEWVVVLDTKRRDEGEDNQFIPVVTITFIVEDESRLQSAQNSATSLAKAAAEGTLSKDKEFKEVSVTLIKDNEKERPAQPVNNGKTELGGGAIAGVVVACVILAIIIIVEIAFLVYNSRNQKRPRSVDEPENVIYISDSDSEIDQSSDSSSSESESDDDEESKEEEESSSYNDSVGDFSSSEDEKKEEPLKKEEESESESESDSDSESESESESESDSDSESESDSESTDSSSASSSSE